MVSLRTIVIPAQAGIQAGVSAQKQTVRGGLSSWVPAFAGTTSGVPFARRDLDLCDRIRRDCPAFRRRAETAGVWLIHYLGLELKEPKVATEQASAPDSTATLMAEAQVVFAGGATAARLYDRDKLRTGNRIAGPAIVLQMDTTLVMPPGRAGEVDASGNLLLERAS